VPALYAICVLDLKIVEWGAEEKAAALPLSTNEA
jgi:hypothetical protein